MKAQLRNRFWGSLASHAETMFPGDIRLHILLIGLLVGTQAFFTWLAVRNVRYSASMIGTERDWLTEELAIEEPSDIVAYNRTKTALSHLQSWIGLAFLLIFLYSGLITDAVVAIEELGLGMIGGGVVFFLGLTLAMRLFALPFDAVDTFVIEELFDFNNQTVRLWLRDTVLGLGIAIVLTAVIAGVILAFITFLPTWWWVAGTLFFVAFALVMQVLYPRVIAPLFNEFEPIESGDVREAVESVFERAGFRCEELYTMDASRRSSHVNAYFVGFGRTKRVVLFDTLLDTMDLPEVQSVLAHELAHWQRHHVWKRLGAASLRIGVVLFALWYLLTGPWLYDIFAFPETATYAALFVGMLFIVPVMQLTAPLENRLSLAHEREADRFAVEVMDDGEPMVSALAELGKENLANPFPHPVYAAFHHSHPPIPERIRRIREHAQ